MCIRDNTSNAKTPDTVTVTCRQQMQAVVERIQAKAERLEDKHCLLGLLCLGAVHSHVCSPHVGLDKKLVKLMLDLHHKVRFFSILAVVSELWEVAVLLLLLVVDYLFSSGECVFGVRV